MFKFITLAALFSIAYAHLYDAHGNAIPVYVSHVTADAHLGASAAYQPQPSYANQQSYSSVPQQHMVYAPPKQESYSYRQQSFNLPKQQSYANQQPQSYSYPQQSSSGLSNQLPYNLPGDFADSKLEHPVYYDAKQASYSYPKSTITVLPTLHIPPIPSSYAPSVNSYQSHHPAETQNVDAQPSHYPSVASQSALPSHNFGYTSGSNVIHSGSNAAPSGSW